MAFIEKLIGQVEEYKRFNVTHAVGAGAANFWTDIMLVQYPGPIRHCLDRLRGP